MKINDHYLGILVNLYFGDHVFGGAIGSLAISSLINLGYSIFVSM